jgi:RHS repeat-associated protein
MPFGGKRGQGAGITASNYLFTDQELDKESGLYNYDARLYDPVVGKFASADPIVQAPFFSQSFNRYAYSFNNPLIYVDPTGYNAADFGDSKNDDNLSGDTEDKDKTYEPTVTTVKDVTYTDPLTRKTRHYKEVGWVTLNGSATGNSTTSSSTGSTAPGDLDGGEGYGGITSGSSLLAAALPIAITTSIADGPLPIGDLFALGILATASAYDAANVTFVTYTLSNPATGQLYGGRASGFGHPHRVMMRRYYSHHMRVHGFGNPVLDKAIQGIANYPAIRGREQQLIDFIGGVGSRTCANKRRGVAKWNYAGRTMHELSNTAFGRLAPYTGY